MYDSIYDEREAGDISVVIRFLKGFGSRQQLGKARSNV